MKRKPYHRFWEELRKQAHSKGLSRADRIQFLQHFHCCSVCCIEGMMQVEPGNNITIGKGKIIPSRPYEIGGLQVLVLDYEGVSNQWWKDLPIKEKLSYDGKHVYAFCINTRPPGTNRGSEYDVIWVDIIKTAKMKVVDDPAKILALKREAL